MADTIKTDTALLARFPDPVAIQRGQSISGRGIIEYQALRDTYVKIRGEQLRAQTRVVDTGLVASNPTTANTIALYRINLSAGNPMVGGVLKHFATAADQLFLGGADIVAYDLAGGAIVALTADGQTYNAVLVVVKVAGVLSLRIVVGAEAADTAELAVTSTQILAALKAGIGVTLDSEVYLVVARIKIQRVATDTITLTHTSATTDDELAGERALGTAGDIVS